MVIKYTLAGVLIDDIKKKKKDKDEKNKEKSNEEK